jgi:sphingomyelin phosphodiesterase
MCEYPKFTEISAEDDAQRILSYKPDHLKSNDFVDKLYDQIAADPNAKDRPTLRIVQLSDPHINSEYVPGTNAECNMPDCCMAENGPAPTPEAAAGEWGDIRCDTPPKTLDNMMQFIGSEIKPDIFFWSGDNSAHTVWRNTRKEVVDYTKYITDSYNKYVGEGETTMYPCLGNHDTWPVNNDDFSGPGACPAIQEISKMWAPWLTEKAMDTFQKWGYYS